jgi:hypothetical protein
MCEVIPPLTHISSWRGAYLSTEATLRLQETKSKMSGNKTSIETKIKNKIDFVPLCVKAESHKVKRFMDEASKY